MRILISPTIQENFRWSLGFGRIAVGDGYEHQIRRCPDPDPSETDFKAAHQIEALIKNRAPIELSIAVSIFEYQDAILAFAFLGADRIGIAFGNPQTPTVIDREGNRLPHIR